MAISSRWHFSSRDAAEAKGVTEPCTCKGAKRYPTKDHLRGREWQVIVPGAPRRSFERKTGVGGAEEWETKVKADQLAGVVPVDTRRGEVLFADYARKVVREHYARNANSRRTVLGRLTKHLIPHFEGMRMLDGDITTSSVNAWLVHLRTKSRSKHNSTPLAENTVELVWTVLAMVMRVAVEVDKIRTTNPCWGIKRPTRTYRSQVNPIEVWEQDVVDALLAAIDDYHHGIALLAATCGHRQGEAFAVAVEDIQPLRKRITIRHQVALAEDDTTLILVPPKGNKARTVALNPHVGRALAHHIERYGTTPITCTCCNKTWKLLFTNGGTLLAKRDWNRTVWYPTLTAAGMNPGDGGLHQLRHFFVSTLIEGGATERHIMEYCGHSSITMTYNIYGHLFKRAHDKTNDIIGAAFFGDAGTLKEGQADHG